MANMTFGVNIIPKANTDVTLGNSDNPWEIVSPVLTGTPSAPTPSSSHGSQVANVTYVNTAVSGKVDVAQGSQNEGKVLVVNASGNLEPTTVPIATAITTAQIDTLFV